MTFYDQRWELWQIYRNIKNETKTDETFALVAFSFLKVLPMICRLF